MWNHKIRNWLYPAIVIIAVICIGWSLVHYKTNAHSYEECTRAAQIAALNDLELNTAIDPDHKPDESDQNQKNISNQISCSDLSAQWAMSDIAMLGYIAGMIGLVFLGITVFETKSAADLTRQALEETKKNSRRELRAYVHAVPYGANLHNTDDVPTIFLRLFNKGQTPAINILCDVKASLEVNGETISSDKFPVKVTIPPNSHEDIIWPFMEDDIHEGWDVRIFFLVEYNDIFGSDRHVSIGLNITKSSFPSSSPYIIETKFTREVTSGSLPDPVPNVRYKEEVILPYVAYGDDLQEEAKKYAETNNAS